MDDDSSDEELAAYIEYIRSLLRDDPYDAESAAELADALAMAIDRSTASESAGTVQALRDFVAELGGLMTRFPAGHWLFPALAAYQGLAYEQLWGLCDDPADLDHAIDMLGGVLETLPTADEEWADVAVTVGRLRYERLDRRPDPADRDAFITWTRWLLGRCDEKDKEQYSERPGALPAESAALVREHAAMCLLERADEETGDRRADLDEAIGHFEVLAAAGSAAAIGRRDLLALLTLACWDRVGGDASQYEQVDRMVGHAKEAWPLLERDTEDWLLVGFYLAIGLYEQLHRPRAKYDAESANLIITVVTEIEPGLRDEPEMHLQAAALLGLCLVARAQETGNTADLTAAEPWLMRAAAELPAGDPRWSEVTQTLATAVFILANLGLMTEHFDVAVRLLRAATEHPVDDPEIAAMSRAALGGSLLLRAFYKGTRDATEGIEHLQAAYEMTPADSGYRVMITANLGSGLLTRYMLTGNRQDLDAALHYMGSVYGTESFARSRIEDNLVANLEFTVRANRGMLGIARGLDGDLTALDAAIEELRTATGLLPPGHPYRLKLRGDLALAMLLRAGHEDGTVTGLLEAAAELDSVAATLPAGNLMNTYARLRAGAALGAVGMRTGNDLLLREAAARLGRVRGDLSPGFADLPRVTGQVGLVWAELYDRTHGESDFQDAQAWLTQAVAEFEAQPGHPQHASVLIRLARLRRAYGARSAAVEAGLAALRVRVRDVLLQTGPAHGLTAARTAAGEAAEVAGWCLDDDGPGAAREPGAAAAAVEAMELGRGLVLHAATSVASLPELLAAAGHDDLASQWQELAATGERGQPWEQGEADVNGLLTVTALAVPSDLRERTLKVLAGAAPPGSAPVVGRLLDPPGYADIAEALARTGADALVYLLPPSGSPSAHAGHALVVRADATVEPWDKPLPLLHQKTSGALDDYAAAHAALIRLRPPGYAGAEELAQYEGEKSRVEARWRTALDPLCEWAWLTVVGPLLESLPAQPRAAVPPRLVLVPVGRLSLVPWHAAWCRDARGDLRYAFGEAVFSYAASGRQLVQVSRRPVLPLRADPVIVAPMPDEAEQLLFAFEEAEGIRDRYYRNARYFGRATWSGEPDAEGTPGEVLGVMPSATRTGASLLHLACHGDVDGAAPEQSHLLLANDLPLLVTAILRAAIGRQEDAPGGVVDLSACRTDLTAADYDEALTLATAFLAAGAVTVVGTRWAVPDGPSSVLMFMYHHFLAHRGREPRDALRDAQLWMLNPSREVPEEMPQLLRNQVWSQLAEMTAWAGVTHQGR